MRVPVLATVDRALHRDDGPLTRRVPSRAGAPLAFAVVAAFAAGALCVAAGRSAVDGWAVNGWAFDGWAVGGWTVDGWVVAAVAVVVLAAGLPARAPHTGALDWLVPAALRAAEYLFVTAVALVHAVPAPVVFLLLFALAMHHYDLTARMEKGAPARGSAGGNLGWDGRVLVLAVAAVAGAATAGVAVLAGHVLLMFGIGAVAAWSATRARPVLVGEGGPR
jgi:hypothetical protein